MQTDQTYFPLPHRTRKILKIHYSDILYLEGSKNYTIIHLQSGKVKISPRTLLFHVNNSVDDSFIRIHRAFCVNKFFIKQYDPKLSPEFLLLEGDIQLAVSRRKKKALALMES